MKSKIFLGLILLVLFLGSSCEVMINPFMGTILSQFNSVSFDFGNVLVGSFSDETLTVTNVGTDPVVIYDLQFQNYGLGTNVGEFSFISGWTGSDVIINPGSSHGITVRFAPDSEGVKVVQVLVEHNSTNIVSPFYVDLFGAGYNPTSPIFSIDPTSYNYGDIDIDKYKDNSFIISNIGTSDLNVSSISISGVNSSNFTIQSGGSPTTIFAGNNHTIIVRFTSQLPLGSKNASLDIIHNALGSPSNVPLSGTVVDIPPIQITTTTLPDATNWVVYSVVLQISGGSGGTLSWSIVSGNLPDGLNLNSQTGEISGTPIQTGIFNFTVEVDDSGETDTQVLTLNINSGGGWANVTPMSFYIPERAIIAVKGYKIYFFCGYTDRSIRVFDTQNNTFEIKPTSVLYVARNRGCAVTVGDYIYIIGGNTDRVERYDTVNDSIAYDTPYFFTDMDFAATEYAGEIYVFGGDFNGRTVRKFTPGLAGSDGSWSFLSALTTSIKQHGVVAYGGNFIFFGGYDSSSYYNLMREYNIISGETSTSLGSLQYDTGRCQYGKIGDDLFICNREYNGATWYFHKYNLISNTATNLVNCPLDPGHSFASQYTECMGRIYITSGHVGSSNIYAYTP